MPYHCRPLRKSFSADWIYNAGMQSDPLTLTSALDALHAGKVTAQELTGSCFRQIERLNPQLNAFITVLGIQAGLEAQLPGTVHRVTSALRGIPVAIKDLFDTA